MRLGKAVLVIGCIIRAAKAKKFGSANQIGMTGLKRVDAGTAVAEYCGVGAATVIARPRHSSRGVGG